MKYRYYVGYAAAQFQCCNERSNGGFNFRCPYCGDSQKSSMKARAYSFCKDDFYAFKCHNCGKGNSLIGFIRDHLPGLYEEYVQEFKDSQTPPHAPMSSMEGTEQRPDPELRNCHQGNQVIIRSGEDQDSLFRIISIGTSRRSSSFNPSCF